jgi:phage tail sheath protein FI
MAVVQYKTPGVYVEELDAFPPSIVGVETAVPVFIGYTAKAEKNGRSLALQPIRIGSMVEYTAVFGGAHKYAFKFTPMAITAAYVKDAEEKAKAAEAAQTAAAQKVTDAGTDETKKASAQKEKDAADAEVAKLRPAADKLKANFEKTPAGAAEKAAAAAEKELDDAKKKTPAATQAELDALKDKAAPLRKKANEAAAAAAVPRDVRIGDQDYGLVLGKNFYLYNCLRLFYANGGGNCYIVSVGTYDAAPSDADLTKGLDAVHDLVGPTMLVIPEAAALADTAYDKLVQAMLKQCLDTQDRVAILDVYGTAHPQDAQDFTDKIARFREKTIGGTNSQFLRYGMAYTPFLRTSIVDPAEVSFRPSSRRRSTGSIPRK